jgi:hypothetical protein
MAHNLVAQVGRDGSTAQAADNHEDQHGSGGTSGGNNNGGFFANLFSCCGPKGGSGSVELNDRQTSADSMLPPLAPEDKGKKCLVLDLDETLVHSSFKPVANADFIIPVEIDDQVYQVYVLKRPRVDDFMKAVGEKFEVVIFTASLSKVSILFLYWCICVERPEKEEGENYRHYLIHRFSSNFFFFFFHFLISFSL